MKKVLFTLLSWFFIVMAAMSQGYEYENISVEEGLSQSSVTCIAQDEKGFLWFGTRDGLNRYDGQEFKVYRKIPFDTTSLGSNQIMALLTFDLKGVFVGTKNGLFWHDNATQKFRKIRLTPDATPLEIRKLYRDKYDNIWVGTMNGFYRVQFGGFENGFQTTPYFYQKGIDLKDTLNFSAFDFLHDSHNFHWMATNVGLFRFPLTETGEFNVKNQLSATIETFRLLDEKVFSVVEHSNGYIYIYCPGEIIQFDPKTENLKVLTNFDQFLDPGIHKISEMENGQIVLYNPFEMTFFQMKDHGTLGEPQSIASPTFGNAQYSHRINHVLEDIVNKDLFWLATDIGGVIKMYKPNRVFNTHFLRDVPGLEMANPYVRHIITDEKRIWINLGLGLLVYDKAKEEYLFYDDFHLPRLKLSATTISSLYKGADKGIYASVHGGFLKISVDETDNLQVRYYSLDQEIPTRAYSVFETEKYLLMGGGRGRLSIVDKKNYKEVSAIELSAFSGNTSRLLTSDVLLDARDNLWVGTSHGLVVVQNFDPEKPEDSKPTIFSIQS